MKNEKTKKVLSLLFGPLMSATLWSSNLQARMHSKMPITEGVGRLVLGEEYSISNKAEFDRFRKLVNDGRLEEGAKIALVNDIDLTEEEVYTPVGTSLICPFKGEFNGENHEIRLEIREINHEYNGDFPVFLLCESAGIFGIAQDAEVKNLKVAGSIVIDGDAEGVKYTGAIAGIADRSRIINCCSECRIVLRNGEFVGGVVGFAVTETAMCMCSNKGNILADSSIACGGITTMMGRSSSKVCACYNTGDINFIGKRGRISPTVGGVVGGNSGSASCVAYCYNAGDIEASDASQVWGVCSSRYGCVVEDCYTINNAAAGQQKSEQEMKTREFAEELNGAAAAGLGTEVYRYVEGELPEFLFESVD